MPPDDTSSKVQRLFLVVPVCVWEGCYFHLVGIGQGATQQPMNATPGSAPDSLPQTQRSRVPRVRQCVLNITVIILIMTNTLPTLPAGQ